MGDLQSKSVFVKGSLDHIYNLWADFENFPKFMRRINSVTKTGGNRSHWVMEGPLGKNLEWDAETTAMEPNRRIAWKSIDGDLETNGHVNFRDTGTGEVEVTFSQSYDPPAGMVGDAVASFFDNPDQVLDELLHDFKAFAEGSGRGRFAA